MHSCGDEPQWIWGSDAADQSAADGSCLFKKTFSISKSPKTAILQITCDNQYSIRLNGRLIAVDEDWSSIEQVDVTPLLKQGENEIFVNARNLTEGPAGMMASLQIEQENGERISVQSNDTWSATLQKAGTWDPSAANRKNWKPAFALGGIDETSPWKGKTRLESEIRTIAKSQRANERFELRDGDRVLFLGNTVIEREQRYGYWEAALTAQYPDRNIVFRNLGWSGDTVFGEARARFGTQSEGFGHLEVHVHAVRPTVIICNYGANAAFTGEAGLKQFVGGYENLIDSLETTGAMIVLMAPLRHEKIQGRYLNPDYNNNRQAYVKAIRDIASRRGCRFVELPQQADASLTDNGVHLTEYGYWRTAVDFTEALGLEYRGNSRVRIDATEKTHEATNATVSDLSIDGDTISFVLTPDQLPLPCDLELGPSQQTHPAMCAIQLDGIEQGDYQIKVDDDTSRRQKLQDGSTFHTFTESSVSSINLLKLIKRKNELYFHRWRPQNETYLLLFRKHEQGNNAVEIPKFDPLVADLEKKIATSRIPKPVRYTITKVQ